jgi:hypothetical protein
MHSSQPGLENLGHIVAIIGHIVAIKLYYKYRIKEET